jgi:dipeptidyl aminopeptidase/acylaminoacyl peptidase
MTSLPRFLVTAALALSGAVPASAADVVVPNANLKVEGIPPIPATLAKEVALYTEFRPRSLASWHPVKRELVVATRATSTTQLFDVRTPLAPLAQITDFTEPVRWGTWWPAKPDTLVFARDAGGNEQGQVYRLDPLAKEPVLLTDASRINRPAAMNRARNRLLVTVADVDRTSGPRENPTLDLVLLDPLDPGTARRIATLPGTGWGDFSFSFDDRRLAMIEYRSIAESYVWVMDLATAERRRVLPAPGTDPGRPIASGELNFARDGKSLFLATDRDGEFRRAGRLDLESGRLEAFGPAGWGVEDLALSPDGRTLALLTNEAGVGVLRLHDAETLRELPKPAVPIGTVRGVQWHHDSGALAFGLDSAHSPGDVYVLDRASNRLARWTESKVEGLDASAFRAQEPIRWKSFDGREITGFITRPPAKFTGARPVMIQIHGGPEGQARPGFLGRWNYYIDELGVAIVEPNVRGSTGYGKTFVALDDGMKREDSVRDVGALLDWIAQQPDLDPKRVVVAGGSYGGYMSLAVATTYPERIAGAIDVVGIANFVSFLERTESYRRDLRRVEYGDERDPAMREFLTRISPVNNAAKIRRPLFVAHGRNDPRVPYTEAEQIVETVRKGGTPVWYLLAGNEGHGFAKKENADYYFYATIRFLQETVLK